MLPYTAVDLIAAMDRTFAFADGAPLPANCHGHTSRRSRKIRLAAALTFFATTLRR